MDRENLIFSTCLNDLKAPNSNEGFFQKGKRRSKKDNVNRNFICGCSKTYLSYPALYTHIKNKHNGHPPIGTILHGSNRPANQTGSKISENDGASMISGTENQIGTKALTNKNDDLSQIDEDEDNFMTENRKDQGNQIKPISYQATPGSNNYSTEDFDLIANLGFTGSCNCYYSFKQIPIEKVTVGKTEHDLANMIKLLRLKRVTWEGDTAIIDKKIFEFEKELSQMKAETFPNTFEQEQSKDMDNSLLQAMMAGRFNL